MHCSYVHLSVKAAFCPVTTVATRACNQRSVKEHVVAKFCSSGCKQQQSMPGLQAMLAMLRDLSALAPFSLLADAAHVIGMLVVLKDDVDNIWTSTKQDYVSSKGITAIPFLFGVVIFCYEGIGMILPIEDSMKDKSKVSCPLKPHVDAPSKRVLCECESHRCVVCTLSSHRHLHARHAATYTVNQTRLAQICDIREPRCIHMLCSFGPR
jgi:hypothetical protein